jgi:poly(A) polymerase
MNTFHFDARAMQALKKLQHAGFDSWFVGGCVRDCLIGKSFTDYDLATCALPSAITSLFKKDCELNLIGERFGCVRVRYDDLWIEVTTLRKDVESDGRHTSVAFTTNVAEDAKRRDFTINALYWNEAGIIDFFNGQSDLEHHQVRFIGNANDRIQEDYLRILRFFRFSSSYAKDLNQENLKACDIHQDGLRYLSGNRVWNEWKKMLFEPNSLKVLQAIKTTGIDVTLFGDKLDIQVYTAYKGRDPLLLTSLLLSSVHIQHLTHRLNLTAAQKEWLGTAISLTPDHDFRNLYLRYGQQAKELVYYWACKYLQNPDVILAEGFWEVQNPVFPLSGKDILKLGCQPGPIVGDYLECALEWWAQNNFKPNTQDCLLYVKTLFNK